APVWRGGAARVRPAPPHPGGASAPTSSDATRSNLPTAAGRFLGRTAELATLGDLLPVHRLLTLWGPGGAGKTRLALELARRCSDDFVDGVWFVPLAPVEDPDQVARAAMSAIGMLGADAGDALSTLVGNLKQRQLLLVLDNCEHLLDGAARVAHAVLVGCPHVAILATSREPLLVPEECVWPAPSLSLPPAHADPEALTASDAGAFFADRAALACPQLELDAGGAALAAEICRRLEGIPLALELAAARVRALGLRGVAERLDDQFGLLTAGHRTADTRHRTMCAAIDWSVDLAPTGEQSLLRCLSVFPGSFDLAGAAAVRDPAEETDRATAEVLAGLVDRSLVHSVADARDGRRFRLLEPIRQYAAEHLERLGHGDATRDRHLNLLLEGLPDGMSWFDHSLAWQQAGRHHESITAALAWAIRTENRSAAVRLVGQLWPLWAYTGELPENVETWTDRALALPGDAAPRDVAIALTAKIFRMGDLALVPHVLQLIEGLDDAAEIVAFLRWASALVLQRTDPVGARKALEDLLDHSAAFRPGMIRSVHHQLAWIAVAEDDLQRARRHVGAATDMLDPEHPFWAHYLAAHATILALLGEHEDAEAFVQQALAVSSGTVWGGQLALALSQAAMVAHLGGNPTLAEDRLRELIVLLRRMCTSRWVRDAVQTTVLVLDASDRTIHVTTLLDAVTDAGAVNETPGGTLPFVARAVETARRRALRANPAPKRERPSTRDDVLALALRALDEGPP
ncbi:MAG: ATP-binding protein, partial [Sporichthyaceae bacterium]